MVWGLFGKNGTVPLGDRFCCEKDLLRFETEGKGPFVWGNGTEPLYPDRLLEIVVLQCSQTQGCHGHE